MAQVPPRDPKYTAADLWPPGSKENVEFPPAAFHPVYLGNFRCKERQLLPVRVQEYFASKSLLARMVFRWTKKGFGNINNQTMLYDCLVYFTREADALDAVKYLHRDKYYGHRLNIYPGRTPIVMNPHQTVTYELPKSFKIMPPRFFEDHIVRVAKCVVKSIKRVSTKKIAVQYGGPAQMRKALADFPYMRATPLPIALSDQQNFLEKNVMDEIQELIKDKAFMDMCPETEVLEALYAGTKPNVPMDWVEDEPIPELMFKELTEDFLLKVARTTLQKFGTYCNFAREPTIVVSKKRLERLRQHATQKGSKYGHRFHHLVKDSYSSKTEQMEKLVQARKDRKQGKKFRKNAYKPTYSDFMGNDSEEDFEYCL